MSDERNASGWDGVRDVTHDELQRMTGLSRTALWQDAYKRKILTPGEPRGRWGSLIFSGRAVRRYFQIKFPHLLA